MDGFRIMEQRVYIIFFVQKSNILNPNFLIMVKDILKFNLIDKAHYYLEADPSLTLGQCLDELKMGQWFQNYYLLAMGGAIWVPCSAMLNFLLVHFLFAFLIITA